MALKQQVQPYFIGLQTSGEWNIVSHCKRFNLSMILFLVEKQQISILSSGLTSDQTQDLQH